MSEVPSADVDAFWQAYAQASGADPSQCYDVFSFGDSETMADELGALVVQGRKRATTSLLLWYSMDNDPIPRVGQRSVVTDGKSRPIAIIETRQVDVVPFDEVDADFARAEGEGDGSLAFWVRVHREFFMRECAMAGIVFEEDMLVVCERFALLWPVRAV
jgi:uncharacterized protein YhfF